MTLFNPEITSIQSDIQYHQEQIREAAERLDQIKVAQAYSDIAVASIEDCIQNIDPFYLPILKGHIESMFSQSKNELKKVKAPQEIITTEEEKKEFGSLSYYEVTGRPDTRPDKFEDLAPNITYSSSGRAYVGFNNKQEAEEFREAISEPSMFNDTDTMNGFKYEVKFHCSREYVQQIADSVNSMSEEVKEVQKPNFEKIDGEIIYNHVDNMAYLAFKAKGRADSYGSYLTRILDIAEKYTVSNKPCVAIDSKYELRLENISLEDTLHLQNFDLKKEYDAKQNEEARELWRTTRKRVHPPACKPFPKLTPLEEIKLGDIVYLNSIDNQYKVLSKVELDGIPHIEVICVFNSERPSLVSATSFLKECYLVPVDERQIDPQFKKQEEEEVLKEDVNIYIPKQKPVEIPVIKLCAADTVHRGIGDSQYEVIGTTRKDNDLYAECRLISSSTRAASIGNTYYFKDGLYLVEEEAEPVAV